jgi:hypothetical protein
MGKATENIYPPPGTERLKAYKATAADKYNCSMYVFTATL